MTERLVGYYVDTEGSRFRVRVDVRLEPADHPESFQTVTHEPAPVDLLRFAVSGDVDEHRNGRWKMMGGGQNVDDLRAVTEFADGWTAERRDTLVELWGLWHLNDLRAGCVHQQVVYETNQWGQRRPSLTETKPCGETGYRYGSAWLVEPIPADVLVVMRTFTQDPIHHERNLND